MRLQVAVIACCAAVLGGSPGVVAAQEPAPVIYVGGTPSGVRCEPDVPHLAVWRDSAEQTLYIRAVGGNPDDTVSLTAADAPSGSTFSPPLPWEAVTPSGALVWTPSYAQVGTHAFSLSAEGSSGPTTTCTVSIRVRRSTRLVAEPVVLDALPGAAITFSRFRARLTEASTGEPVAGKAIDFRIGAAGCGAVTDGDGVATCGNALLSLLAIHACGYFAVFEAIGDPTYHRSGATGSLVRVAGTNSPC